MAEVIWPDYLTESDRLINSEVDHTNARSRKLCIFNLVVGVLHGLQLIAQVVLVVVLGGPFLEFKLPLTSYLPAASGGSNSSSSQFVSQQIACLTMAPLVPAFFFVMAVMHFLVSSPLCYTLYSKGVDKRYNYFRWIEYSISSSIIMWIIEMLFGIYDVPLLVSLFAFNAIMNLSCLVMEIHNNAKTATNWTSFIIGCFSGIIPWVVTVIYYIRGIEQKNELPTLTYVTWISYLVFFIAFPVNTILIHKKFGKWNDYIFGEVGYVILSLITRSTVGWLIFCSFYFSRSSYQNHLCS